MLEIMNIRMKKFRRIESIEPTFIQTFAEFMI